MTYFARFASIRRSMLQATEEAADRRGSFEDVLNDYLDDLDDLGGDDRDRIVKECRDRFRIASSFAPPRRSRDLSDEHATIRAEWRIARDEH